MATFRVYPDINRGEARDVEAPTASAAAASYWEERVREGDERADDEERIIVEHDDGENVDPSARWILDEDGTFARFDVSVVHVEVSAVEATGKR